MNDYWNKPRRERWIAFRKYLENESRPEPPDDVSLWFKVTLIAVLISALVVSVTAKMIWQ